MSGTAPPSCVCTRIALADMLRGLKERERERERRERGEREI
jgi:hypothetical protein